MTLVVVVGCETAVGTKALLPGYCRVTVILSVGDIRKCVPS